MSRRDFNSNNNPQQLASQHCISIYLVSTQTAMLKSVEYFLKPSLQYMPGASLYCSPVPVEKPDHYNLTQNEMKKNQIFNQTAKARFA